MLGMTVHHHDIVFTACEVNLSSNENSRHTVIANTVKCLDYSLLCITNLNINVGLTEVY